MTLIGCYEGAVSVARVTGWHVEQLTPQRLGPRARVKVCLCGVVACGERILCITSWPRVGELG